MTQNWDRAISPFQGWNADELGVWLKAKGVDTKSQAQDSKDTLVTQVQSTWYETEDKAQQAWTNVKDWILDTWTDSQLKAFCDKNGVPVPQPRKRDTLLQKARASYETVAQQAGEAASYPGNWLYETWSGKFMARCKRRILTFGRVGPQGMARHERLPCSAAYHGRYSGANPLFLSLN